MQSRSVMLVYFTRAPSAVIPMNAVFSGFGSVALIDGTSNAGLSAACNVKTSPKAARLAADFIPGIGVPFA